MKEMDRVIALAAQTSHLERQSANLESEQQLLHEQVDSKEVDEKSAIQRWKNAERTVNALQEQVERIQKESREERARHTEVVGRFERRRSVEKELENAAGRLKEAAAPKGMPIEDERSNEVSSFVKDVLQDNANLQSGIVELQDMFMGSNEEVENLREKIMLHQNIDPEVHRSIDAGSSKPNSWITSWLERLLLRLLLTSMFIIIIVPPQKMRQRDHWCIAGQKRRTYSTARNQKRVAAD